MNDIKVKDVMTNLVVTLGPQVTIREAARRLLANRISGAPVVEEGRLVGVVSETDLVAAYAHPPLSGSPFRATDPLMFLVHGTVPQLPHLPRVADVMTTNVVRVSPEASIWEAASLIHKHGIRRLPVVDSENYVVGVLARADLVRAMARSDEDVATDVRYAIELVGPENFKRLEVEAHDGVVTVGGTADRKTTRDLAIRIAGQATGVLEIVDELDWEWDDSEIKPEHIAVGTDPWAIGPLVKDGV